jgi:hypothetical protein
MGCDVKSAWFGQSAFRRRVDSAVQVDGKAAAESVVLVWSAVVPDVPNAHLEHGARPGLVSTMASRVLPAFLVASLALAGGCS